MHDRESEWEKDIWAIEREWEMSEWERDMRWERKYHNLTACWKFHGAASFIYLLDTQQEYQAKAKRNVVAAAVATEKSSSMFGRKDGDGVT